MSETKGWRNVCYGDIMDEIHERAGTQRLPVLSVTKTRGPMLASERFGRALYSRKNLANYRLAPRHHIACDPMLLWDGSIGRQDVVDLGIVSPDYRVYRPRDGVDPAFLGFVVRSARMRQRYASGARGTNVRRNRIARSDFLAIQTSLPPLPEQRRIAAILSAADELIEQTEAVIEQLQVVKKAMMQELLTRGLPGRHTRFKNTEVGSIPYEWSIATLGDIAHVFNGNAAGTGGTWLRVIKTKHVYDGMVRLEDPEFANDSTAHKVEEKRYLRPGDTITPNMAHGTIGRVAYVPFVEGKWTVDGQVMVIRSKEEKAVHTRYIFEFLSSHYGRQALLDREIGGIFGERRGQTHLYPRDVRSISVPLPSAEEQARIADALAAFDEPLETNRAVVDNLARSKKGLMSVLLTGEVRVKPDEETP